MRPGDCAWLAVGVGVGAWDLMCPRGETLSETCARYQGARPLLTIAVVGYLCAHLLGCWPRRVDPLRQLSLSVPRERLPWQRRTP